VVTSMTAIMMMMMMMMTDYLFVVMSRSEVTV